MEPIVTTIDIDCPPGRVYEFATDPGRFAQWQPDVVGVRRLGAARFATTRRMTGGERTVVQEITRDDPPSGWSARGVAGPIRPHASIAVEPAGRGSRVTFTLDFDGHGLGVALLPLVRRQAERAAPHSYANLKRLLEHHG
jgi:uncharacterized protein YndB with AHSA1/START domain